MDLGTTKFEHSDRWGQYYGYWDDWIVGSRIGETLGKAWNDLGNVTGF